jgi:hypothetical protein
MCWEKHASSRSAIFGLHDNTLVRHLGESTEIIQRPVKQVVVWF